MQVWREAPIIEVREHVDEEGKTHRTRRRIGGSGLWHQVPAFWTNPVKQGKDKPVPSDAVVVGGTPMPLICVRSSTLACATASSVPNLWAIRRAVGGPSRRIDNGGGARRADD